jgi:streptogramin lyase
MGLRPGTASDGGMGIAYFRRAARHTTCALALMVGVIAAGATGAHAAVDCQSQPGFCRAESFFPADPGNVTALQNLGSTGAPDDDLLSALDDLATAQAADDTDGAAKATGRARAILEGSADPLVAGDTDFLDRKAYKGIALLNTQAKVQDIPSGTTTVDVNEVRFGDHAILDTSMLRFADMGTPFTIRWHITELGTSFGGELSPAAVPAAGAGRNQVVEPLVLGLLATGTRATTQRFHPDGGPEATRLATQTISVDMPAPSDLGGGILDPNLKPGHETFAQIAVGPSTADAPAMPAADQVAGASPEKQIDDALRGPAAPNVGQLQDLVAAMRSRDSLPIASLGGSADAGVAFANAEASTNTREVRLAADTSPNGTMTLALTNLDGLPRDVVVRELRDRSNVAALGALSWGAFTTDVLTTVHLPANMTAPQTVTVKPAAGAFSLWIGDPNGGDQAGTAIALDRGPRRQSLEIGLGPIKPLHEALDGKGAMWVTLANSDQVVRLHPSAATISTQDPEHFSLPGGAAPPVGDAPPPLPILGPGDVAVDKHGIVWVTLTLSNAIARIDPSVAKPGSFDGIKIFNLRPCTDGTCRPPIGAVGVAAPLTRLPLQMKVRDDGKGDTDLFFTEQNADAIGALRVAPDGTQLAEQHFSCVCIQPLGIALDPDGDIWYSEGTSNRIGRMTLDAASPFTTLPALKHYNIPNPVVEPTPGAQPGTGGTGIQPLPATALTTLPHSVALDRKGRVWYSGEASERIGYLDPTQAIPNTTAGFTDTAGPVNEFGRALAPADIAIDPAGTAWIADEYGDQIAKAKIAADGSIDASFAFRPTARNSLTDSPLVDPQGNLWFNEAGANLITRITGVAAKAPAAPPPGTPPSAPQQPKPSTPTPKPGGQPQPKPQPACSITRWLTRKGSGRGARRTLPLLGLTAAKAQSCLGRPARSSRTAKVETWVYPTVDLRFTKGRVDAFTLRRAGLRSDPDRAAIGASVASFRKALGSLARDRRGYRGLVAVGAKNVADVRIAVGPSGKVSRVTVTLVRRAALDRAGRSLLRRLG